MSGLQCNPYLVARAIPPTHGTRGIFQVVSRGWKALQTGVSDAHHDEIPTENAVINFPWLDNWPGALSTGGSEHGRE